MKVKVYSTQMGEKEIDTQALDWGGLQQELRRNGISYKGMKSVIGETKHTLEVDSAGIPQTDFTLFLMPVKTKSGLCLDCDPSNMSYKELRGGIKEILDGDDSDKAKNHFNDEKNYTTKSTDVLRSLYILWMGDTPIETKVSTSYADMPYKGLRAAVKAIIDSVGDDAKAHFNEGKNYTTKGTDILREMLSSWTGEAPKVEAVAQSTTKAEAKTPTATAKVEEPTDKATAKAEKKKKKKEKKEFKRRARAVGNQEPTMADKYEELVREFPGVRNY